jgi:hypothetical protein
MTTETRDKLIIAMARMLLSTAGNGESRSWQRLLDAIIQAEQRL